MSTFMFKNKSSNYTPISNMFIEKYMPKARGEFIKVYLLGLKYCISGELGVNASLMANKLNLLESDVINAFNYWNDEGVVNLIPIDNMGNFNIDFLNLDEETLNEENNINLLQELDKNSTKDMLQDIEKLLGRALSPIEMTTYLKWQNEFNFSQELILLLIQYCISKGKTDYRYIEKVAIGWHDNNIQTSEDAQNYIKKHEDKWIKIKKILNYLGIQSSEIMKPQEDMITKWIDTYDFPLEVIYKACNICFERINKCDFKYIDGILNSWFKDNIKSIDDVNLKNNKKNYNKNNYNKNKSNNYIKKDSFNSYKQRNYDYDELERKLLGWDKK